MSKKKSWRKLDNTAKIFSLDEKNNTNIFRYSVILKQSINPSILAKVLTKTLKDIPSFKVKIGTGLFWNYLDHNPKDPIIKKDFNLPCKHINTKTNNNYLFKVTYHKNKINLDIFHILTDGVGALTFLKALIYNYLALKHNLPKSPQSITYPSYEDKCLKYYNKEHKLAYNFKSAYQIPGNPNKNTNNTYHYTLNIKELKQLCLSLDTTLTEYLTAIYIYAIYLSLYNKNSHKEINLTVPINLRPHYQDETLANFFTYMNITTNLIGKDTITFQELLTHIHNEFTQKLTKEQIPKYLARDVTLGMNIPIRLVPLPLKKLFIKFLGTLITKSTTSTLSNIGLINIEPKYQPYIDNIFVLVIPSKSQKIKCTICSYKDNLNITINSNINDLYFQNTYLSLLQEHLTNIKIITNHQTQKKGTKLCINQKLKNIN